LEKLNEKKFAAGTSSNSIIIYEYFEKIGILLGHTENVNVLVKVKESKNQLLSGSDDKRIILW
jgi:WD40 repeat protein